jgi:hypothetical protein
MASVSCQILRKVGNSSSPIALPTPEGFPADATIDWSRSVTIPVTEARCQENYDLGVYLFYKEDTEGATECFSKAIDHFFELDLDKISYCSVRESFLRGFALALLIPFDDIKARKRGKKMVPSYTQQLQDCWRVKDFEVRFDPTVLLHFAHFLGTIFQYR